MKNISRNWAVGGVLQFAAGRGDYHFYGAALRARRYLDDRWSLEGALGVFDENDEANRQIRAIPLYGEGVVSAGGGLSVFTRVQRVKYHTTRYYYPYYPLSQTEDTDVSLQVGLRLGPRPQVVTVPGMVATTLYILFSGSQVVY